MRKEAGSKKFIKFIKLHMETSSKRKSWVNWTLFFGTMIVVFLLGAAFEKLTIEPLRRREKMDYEMSTLMMTIGISMFLQNLVLIVFGPKKLPDLAKSIAKGLAELKKATEDVKQSLEQDETLKEAKQDLADSISGIQRQVAQEGSEALKAEEKKNTEMRVNSTPPKSGGVDGAGAPPAGETKTDGEG